MKARAVRGGEKGWKRKIRRKKKKQEKEEEEIDV